MAINTLSVGRDITLNIHSPSGEINIPTVISFTCKPKPDVRSSVAMNGNVLFAPIPLGYAGSIVIDRTSPALQQIWTAYENAYYGGQNLLASTITETIKEADGTVTQWIATGVMFDAQDFGDWMGNDIVKQTLNFNASKYKQVV
jgi:hypothetical protein